MERGEVGCAPLRLGLGAGPAGAGRDSWFQGLVSDGALAAGGAQGRARAAGDGNAGFLSWGLRM